MAVGDLGDPEKELHEVRVVEDVLPRVGHISAMVADRWERKARAAELVT